MARVNPQTYNSIKALTENPDTIVVIFSGSAKVRSPLWLQVGSLLRFSRSRSTLGSAVCHIQQCTTPAVTAKDCCLG